MNEQEPDPLKIVVSVHGRWHGFDLADGLHQRGYLARLLTTYPASVAAKFLPLGVPIMTAPWLELRRRFYDKFPLGRKPDLAIAKAFANFACRHAIGKVDVLVGWSSATLEAIPPAHEFGTKVVIERGSSHIVHQTDVLTAAYQEFGLNFAGTHPEIIAREEQEYAAADAIAVPTQFAASTFAERGLGEKLIVNPYGVDLTRFSPPAEPNRNTKPRILFVGSVGIRKGVPWLLRAFAGLSDIAELHLIGPVEKGFEKILAQHKLAGVTLRGALPSGQLPAELKAADVFCLPSLEEGFPLSMLQAMASELPIVTTKEAGVEDIIEPNIEGLIVLSKDSANLAEALGQLVNDADQRRQLGIAARRRVEQGFSWDDYIDRAIRAYHALAATT
ncbi:MAG: glycosyltransferase family 4 protein [Rhodospirillaceae bacterium]|nr:glycosyltransferase family 4 protein [Rhodospirillaceae bacterium]